jgi:hypothetical protein
MNKTRAEQETIIRRAADEQTWDVFTEDPRVIRVLERKHGLGRAHGSGFRWTLGASCISIRGVPVRSEAQRAADAKAGERLRAARKP